MLQRPRMASNLDAADHLFPHLAMFVVNHLPVKVYQLFDVGLRTEGNM